MTQKIEVRGNFDRWSRVSLEEARRRVAGIGVSSAVGVLTAEEFSDIIDKRYLRGITFAELFKDTEDDMHV